MDAGLTGPSFTWVFSFNDCSTFDCLTDASALDVPATTEMLRGPRVDPCPGVRGSAMERGGSPLERAMRLKSLNPISPQVSS